MSQDRSVSPRSIRVALLGCGVVGSQVVRLLREQSDELAARIGAPIELAGIAVRRPQRHADVPADLLTTDAAGLVGRSDVDVVVELMGGIEPARDLLLDALKNGRSVVSANKALLAEEGEALATAARESGADLYYEASVAGAIPLLRPIQQSLAGDRIHRVAGIVNGTTNFILSAMESTGAGYADALEEAGRLGYAEADPTADVDGYDAASKAAILATLAFHTRVTASDVYREGIRDVTATDIASAKALGCSVKLLAICEQVDGEAGSSVSARVYPAMIPKSPPAGLGVRRVQRRVRRGRRRRAADVLRPGRRWPADRERRARRPRRRRAQQGHRRARTPRHRPRAPAVAADRRGPHPLPRERRRPRPRGRARRGRLGVRRARRQHRDGEAGGGDVADRSSTYRGGRETSNADDAGHGGDAGTDATLVVVTHEAPDAALRATVDALSGLDSVRGVASVLRVEGLGRPVHALGGPQ